MLGVERGEDHFAKTIRGCPVNKLNDRRPHRLAVRVEPRVAVTIQLLERWHCDPSPAFWADHQLRVVNDHPRWRLDRQEAENRAGLIAEGREFLDLRGSRSRR